VTVASTSSELTARLANVSESVLNIFSEAPFD
jgi:hypothetical protein